MGRKNRFGVFVPSELRWTIGKILSSASVQFVHDAHRYLTKTTNKREKKLLRKMIQRIKDGNLELTDWLTPEEFLKQPEKYLKKKLGPP